MNGHTPEARNPLDRELISVPIPLGDTTARVTIPKDLTMKEADRIYEILKSICVE